LFTDGAPEPPECLSEYRELEAAITADGRANGLAARRCAMIRPHPSAERVTPGIYTRRPEMEQSI